MLRDPEEVEKDRKKIFTLGLNAGNTWNSATLRNGFTRSYIGSYFANTNTNQFFSYLSSSTF